MNVTRLHVPRGYGKCRCESRYSGIASSWAEFRREFSSRIPMGSCDTEDPRRRTRRMCNTGRDARVHRAASRTRDTPARCRRFTDSDTVTVTDDAPHVTPGSREHPPCLRYDTLNVRGTWDVSSRIFIDRFSLSLSLRPSFSAHRESPRLFLLNPVRIARRDRESFAESIDLWRGAAHSHTQREKSDEELTNRSDSINLDRILNFFVLDNEP